MTLPLAGLRGSQRPRVLTRPPFKSEDAGVEAIELAASVGLILDPWQQLLVKLTLAEQADGRYAADTVGALVARQNGKGGWLEAVVLHGLFLVQDPLTLWTAHQFKTSTEAFLRIRGWIDGSADLSRMVKRINAAHGEEGIELSSGPRLRFLARSKSSGRGFSPQRVIFDEAQELATVAQEAIVPSMRAQWNKQAIYTGTVPGPDVNYPEVFTRLRDRGRKGGSRRLAWAEWSPKGSDDPAFHVDLDDRKNWAAANPALGFRVSEDSLESDREQMQDDSFAREALSVWPNTGVTVSPFGAGRWEACVVTESEIVDNLVFALAVSIDRKHMRFGAAGLNDDGLVHVELADNKSSSAPTSYSPKAAVAEAVRLTREHGARLVIDGKGPASPLIPDLEAQDVPLVVADTGGVCDAYANIYDRVQASELVHLADPALDAAVAGAVPRAVGDRLAWGRRQSSVDISPLEAVTLAAWQVDKPGAPEVIPSVAYR